VSGTSWDRRTAYRNQMLMPPDSSSMLIQVSKWLWTSTGTNHSRIYFSTFL